MANTIRCSKTLLSPEKQFAASIALCGCFACANKTATAFVSYNGL